MVMYTSIQILAHPAASLYVCKQSSIRRTQCYIRQNIEQDNETRAVEERWQYITHIIIYQTVPLVCVMYNNAHNMNCFASLLLQEELFFFKLTHASDTSL